MRPDLVADVGNTRVKWGIVAEDGGSVAEVLSLPDEAAAWSACYAILESKYSFRERTCVIASVRPERSDRLEGWFQQVGWTVRRLHRPDELPLCLDVVEPRRVGIDRLLNAVAALRQLHPGEPGILADAGSAVTVDWLDENHVYRGGTIFPGVRLMAEALHAYTAFLPLVQVTHPIPDLPARDTTPAMQVGIFHAVVGAIERIARQLAEQSRVPPRLFVTGGDAPLLADAIGFSSTPNLWPAMTLEGIVDTARGW